jgi:uncharacterized iron-regulated protein
LKSEIIKLRKKIYHNLKNKAFSLEEQSSELTQYYADQVKASQRTFEISTLDELSKKVLSSKVIYLGDFHTFDQNIRNVLRIVKFILSNKSKCIIGLEMISSQHQFYLDAYVEGHLTDLEFLECINYHHSWRFPWTHYKLIFELAKKYKLKMIALNTEGNLKKRDQFAAEKIKKKLQENPNAHFLIFYGELHITNNKIPLLIQQSIPGINTTIIHQNLDEVYWKLITQNKEQGVVKFTDDEFCIVTAPPWVKYESMIYWYENVDDDPDFDIHEYIIENGAKIFNEDTHENFYNICLELIGHLDLDYIANDLEDFNLYDHSQLEYIEEELETNLPPSVFQFYKFLIQTNKSFRLPHKNTFYCSSYSMNRISYLAGVHILHYILTKKNIFTHDILNTKSNQKKFLLFCYEAIFAYFFSKIINPHRKCEMYQELLQLENKEAQIAIAILDDGKKIAPHLKYCSLQVIHQCALYVGHILGEYLYFKMTKQKTPIHFKAFFQSIEITPKHFHQTKKNLLSELNYKKHFKRYF